MAAIGVSTALIFGLDVHAPVAGSDAAAPERRSTIQVYLQPLISRQIVDPEKAASQRATKAAVAPALQTPARPVPRATIVRRDAAPPDSILLPAARPPAHREAASNLPAAAPEAPAPAPVAASPTKALRLDPGVLRSAARASPGAVTALAQASGQELDLTANAGGTRWARAVGAAGRSDCLAPDEHASLLSAVSIAARALSGRCP